MVFLGIESFEFFVKGFVGFIIYEAGPWIAGVSGSFT